MEHPVLPGYTFFVKTAVSIPDDLFAQVDSAARREGVSRSKFLQDAARDRLDRLALADETAQINAALAAIPGIDHDPEWVSSSKRHLAAFTTRDEW